MVNNMKKHIKIWLIIDAIIVIGFSFFPVFTNIAIPGLLQVVIITLIIIPILWLVHEKIKLQQGFRRILLMFVFLWILCAYLGGLGIAIMKLIKG